MPNSFFRIATLLPSGLHGGLLNPGMVKYPFTLATESGLKTCLAIMRTSFMPPRPTPLYTHLFSLTSATSMSFKPFLSYGALLRTLYIPLLEKYSSLCGTFVDFAACLYVENFGPLRYAAPPLCSSRKRVNEPKLSRNPSGDVDASNLPRAKDHDEPFTVLHIPKDIRDETYVAVFLSYWLCNFVLPHYKVGKVRASTCKVASRMAHGECFSLAIPVLASIYRGLRNMSTSTNLFESSAIFPIHYVYGWIGRYL
ncbi:UNVERIFIED_CONTAM: hypothetical protein Sradi_6945600 [Sesamum radiatum]|uniref:Aminotransferase-like plant mobile domain-containing protein n=1 Tax=Sesamum radiatum TaxID=300843 RepID=A0AAW2JHA9_SESRA